MTRIGCVVSSALLFACGAGRVDSAQQHPNLTFPAKLPRQPGTAAAPAAPSTSAAPPSVPDPPALRSLDHFRIELSYNHGTIQITKVEALRFSEPREGKRRTGRFALELWSKDTLLDRLRFDFPLLAAEQPAQDDQRPLRREALFGPGAEVSTKLDAASVPEITRAKIVDRATQQVTEVAWPPVVAAVPAGAPEKK